MADPIVDVQHYPRTWKFSRWTTGISNSQALKQIYGVSFGYTSTKKKVSAASATAILGSTASRTSTNTVSSGITQPDVPRALSVTPGGTTSDLLNSAVVVTGRNVEGKVITESFQLVPSSSTIINGSKAFMTVTSVFFPAQGGTGATITVGTQNKLGVFHRLIPNQTSVRVYSSASITTDPTIEAAPTVVANDGTLEYNLVTPATTPNGSRFVYICYAFDQWNPVGQLNDGTKAAGDYLWMTSTSTSTSSTSTSTTMLTTTTTSTSTSSTSVSTSSTSVSTSSTSTSTTTAP